MTQLVNQGGIVFQGPVVLPPLFKYCKRQHMESMMQLGSVRLGSLSDYRRQEGRGGMVSDVHEGAKRIDGYIERLAPENRHRYPAVQGLFGPSTRINGLSVSNVVMLAPDQLVFCASHTYDEAAHRQWFEQEGYDACYRINHPMEFCRAITDALGQRFAPGWLMPVAYINGEDISSPTAGVDPAFVKRPAGYADQCEVRNTWLSVDGQMVIEGMVVERSAAFMHCSRHAVL